jgi:translocator protein
LDGDFAARITTKPMLLYLIQLAFNFAWTPLFFTIRKLLLASIDISILWALVIATIYEFYQVDPVSSYLLLPYLAWVSFASVLCITITKLNWKKKPE